MLHVDIPTLPEFKALSQTRADACVSIYLATTPLTQDAGQARTELGNFARGAREQLEEAGFDKRRLAALMEEFDGLVEDNDFWRMQANSLAVLATPDTIRSFRLANKLTPLVEVSDRFHLKPLLRALTFPHSAFVLALSENDVRLVEVFTDLPARTVRVDNMPADAASAVGKSTLNDRSHAGRIHGTEGQNVRLRQYCRQVDAVLRPVLAGRDTPLILAANNRLDSIFRSVNSYPGLLDRGIGETTDRTSGAELAEAARPILDEANEKDIADLKALFETRNGQRRATTDISDAARAATFGAVEALLVDIDTVVPGRVDEESGAVSFAESDDSTSYGIIDEIAARALATGARVLGVRRSDIPDGGELAAILRYAV